MTNISANIETINVDDLEFSVKSQPQLFSGFHRKFKEHRENVQIPQESYTLCTQHDDIYIRSFMGWGSHPLEDSPGRDVFVLHIGDWQMAITTPVQWSADCEDGSCKWVLDTFGEFGVTFFNPALGRPEFVTVAKRNNFRSEKEKDVVVAIMMKALSNYNHMRDRHRKRKDGKPISEQEAEYVRQLYRSDKTACKEYETKNFDFYDTIDKQGDSTVSLSNSAAAALNQIGVSDGS